MVRDRLKKSIILSTTAFFALQAAVFAAFALSRGFWSLYGPLFLAVSAAFHLFLLMMLFLFKADFVIEGTDALLERMNLANAITLFRVSTLPTVLFLVIAAKDFRIRGPLLALVILVFVTDFADGFVSRRRKQVTKVGKMMDSASDYSLLIVLTIVFYWYFLIPRWFFLLVIARLLVQTVLVGVLIAVRGRIVPRTSFLGKAAVASLMTLYSAEILEIVVGPALALPLRVLEAATALVLVASVADKVLIFARDLRAARSAGDGETSQGDS